MGEGRVRSVFLGSFLTGCNMEIGCKESKYRSRKTRLEDLAVIEEKNNVGLNYSRGNRDARKMRLSDTKVVTN